MKYKLALLLGALLCASGIVAPTPAEAIGISIEIGDRPYYNHGAYYWHHGVRWYWVPGHWRWHHGRKVWIHGHYTHR
jgi:hypothetical protein